MSVCCSPAQTHERMPPPPCAALQNGAGGDGALQETALSFTGIVTIVTLCCCSTMSCVALCIKLVSWMFGHRGRRRRILLRPHGQGAGEHEEGLCPHPPRTVIVLDTNPSEGRDGCALHESEIELREVPFGNIEEQRGVYKDGSSGAARAAGSSTKDGEDERLNGGGGSRMKRETTNGSTMTRTGTPSVIGQERSYYSSSGSSHEEDADVEGDGEAAEGHDGDGDEEEEHTERRRLR